MEELSPSRPTPKPRPWASRLRKLAARFRFPGAGTDGRRPREVGGAGRFAALHVLALWSLAVARPIFEIAGRSPEFFVAHDAGGADLPALAALLCLGGPAACLLFVGLVGRSGGWRWRRRAVSAVVGGLTGAIALAALKPLGGWPDGLVVGLAVLAGAAAASAYARFAPARLFATFLTPAVVVVPALFLIEPGVSRLLRPAAEVEALDGVAFKATPPVVVVVFDQLQLAALLDREGNIDRAAFPHFAALADDATWFRNATAVAELTQYALPAILTGTDPVPRRLPVAAEHPANLFTLLGGRYRLQVLEPLTGLCPETLCPPERAALPVRLAGVLRDLTVVYLAAVLPRGMAESLPPTTQSWKDFAATRTLEDRWREVRGDDRRATAVRFIESIEGTAEPSLYFMHSLLPHEPWLYLPSGQQFTVQRHSIGLRRGKWVDDAWVAALNLQRYLLQVGYADTLLGALVARLRETGIYDDALIVVTADHGANLRAGLSFRRPDASTVVDIAAVPLFVKRPGQRRGEAVDAVVEVTDILPTLAAELGAEAPWRTDGSNLFDPGGRPRSSRTMFFDRARRRIEAPGDLRADLLRSVARKFDRFETGNPLDTPTPDDRYGELIGRAAGEMLVPEPAGFEVVVDSRPLLRDVNPAADFLPAHLTGAVVGLRDGAPAPVLAIALNGVVAAVTRPYAFPVLGRRDVWEAIVDPRRFRPGENSLDVFEVRAAGDQGGVALAAAGATSAAGRWPNLVRDEQAVPLGVEVTGFFETEWVGVRSFRWTRGDARLLAPLDPGSRPAEMAVDVLMTGPPKRLRVTVEGCTVFDATISGAWSATFPLDDCRLAPPDLEIRLLSDTHVPGEHDSRALGVGVGSVELRRPAATPATTAVPALARPP